MHPFNLRWRSEDHRNINSISQTSSSRLDLVKRVSRLLHSIHRKSSQKRMVCCAVTLNLLLWPGPGLATQHILNFAAQTLSSQVGFYSYEAFFLRQLFSQSSARSRHDTLADRVSAVARIRVTPIKFVGYVGETINFSALASDYLDRTIQGVKFDWEESDHADKIQIDDTGRATFLNPGLARITCRAGSVAANAAVLIRPTQRPVQSDADWRADQTSLGSITIGSTEPETGLLSSLLDKIAPTAYAQSGYTGNDFAYDQLWSEPRNLVGSLRDRALEPTALGTVQPEGSNFNMAIPLVGLQGRGIASSLTLYGNSRVWGRHGNAVTFDPVASWPSPGFSLGFGRIVKYDVNYYSGTGKLLLVEPDGTRRYLGSPNGYCPCQPNDGSHIIYSGGMNGGSLLRPDGTVTYFSNINNRLLPTSITDRNGNVIIIAYRPEVDQYGNWTGYSPYAIDYVTDTLGRIIQFHYDTSGRLITITMPGFGGSASNPITQTLVQFDYESRTLGYSFSGLAVENTGYGFFDALKHVYFPATGTGYIFTYSSYGMVYNYSVRRQMSIGSYGWPPQTYITDGVESANVTFNYPVSAGTALSDAPVFSQRTETAINSPTSVYTYSTSTDSGAQTMTFTITRPDSTTVQTTRSTNASLVANGRVVQSEIKNGAASLSKTVLTYANDPAGAPQVQSVTSYDDTATPVKVDFDYDSKGNIVNKREYGHQISSSWQVRRRTHFTYRATSLGGNSWLPGLPTLVEVFDAGQNTNDADDVLIAKSSYDYDNYAAMGGMEDYGGTANPPGHLTFAYNASYTDRGNVTTATQWTDVVAGTTIQHQAKYDIFGNVVKAQVSCCQEKDLTISPDTHFSTVDSEMSGNPTGVHQTTSEDFDFNTSLPTSAVDAGGLATSFGYDAALNPTSMALPTGASANAGYSYDNLSSSKTVSYSEMVNGETAYRWLISTANYDGWGRVIKTVDPNNAQVNTSYDAMGRVISRTNPFTAGGTPGPATTIQYDLANKAVITTLPGGNTVRSDYSGSTVTATDQVGRKIKRETDGLGRLIKVTEQDATGALTQETSYTYNLLDKLTGVNQGGQTRSYKYDAMGRLLYERIPEQGATINDGTGTMWSCKYTYTEFNAVATKQDARGVITTYSYDALHRMAWESYNTSGASGVAATPSVSLSYTAWGAVSNVTIGSEYTEDYTFDSYLRPASVRRWIVGQSSYYLKTYTTGYEYNGGSQLTKLIYPSGQQVSVNHDTKGRLQSLTDGAGYPSYLTGMSYNIAGQVTGLSLGNGVAESFGYDANRLQLTSQVATKSGGPAGGLMNLTYNYQASTGQMGAGTTAGNAGQLMSISGTINATTESANYTYDLVGRLATSNQTSNGTSAQRRFAYDRWGNRTGAWDAVSGGNQIQTIALQQSGGAPTNRVTSVTSGTTLNYTYDAAGNVTNDGAHNYTYDAENRVVSVDSGATAQYKYDHQNRRVSKIIGSSWTHYIWEGSQVIAEHDGTTSYPVYGQPPYQEQSARLDYIYSGSQRIYSRQRASSGGSWTSQYYLSDRLSTRLVLDTSGNVLGRQAHLPFGEDFGESGVQEKRHFTSYESDGELGSAYAVNRQYSQGIGRFSRPDPLGTSGKKEAPQTWNRYTYSTNDPINLKDPLGLFLGCVGCNSESFCGFDGPTIIGDGFDFTAIICDLPLPFPDPTNPTPDPVPPRCSIDAGISGRPQSGISPVSTINSDPKLRLGPHQNVSYWFFFFEVRVFGLGATTPSGWHFNQSALRIERFTISWNGRLFSDTVVFEDLTDKGLAESPIYSRTAGAVHYWIDTPGAPKTRSIKLSDGSTISGPVVSLLTTWQFEWTATYGPDQRRSCSRKFSASISYEGVKEKWATSFPP